MLFLNGKSNPIYLKIAVINKLGWNINGKNEAEVFWQYLKKNNKFKSFEDFKKKGTAEQLICYAYLKALDNYNDVEEAMAYAQIAIKKDKKASYTINIICGLIEAQYYFNGNWCMVWKSTNKVRNNKKLNVDLAPEAIKNIFEYMDLYKDQC
jgi:phenylalanine-4-hydroxylase